jgi:hypothetical protein
MIGYGPAASCAAPVQARPIASPSKAALLYWRRCVTVPSARISAWPVKAPQRVSEPVTA